MRLQQMNTQKQSQTQKLAMTQQMQQSLQILQFSVEELTNYIEEQVLENPLVDMIEPDYIGELPLKSKSDNEESYLNQIPDTYISLFESLIEQVHLDYRDTYLRSLVLFLVEYVDVNGYLTISLEQATEKTNCEPIQMLDALTLLQQLEPVGVGARNLQESLMLQTERDQSAPALAYIILEECFDDLVTRQWTHIAKRFEISLAEVQAVFDYIQTLQPNPGTVYENNQNQLIIPDLKAVVQDGTIHLQSFKSGLPQIKFQQTYFDSLAKYDNSEVNEYISEKKRAFNELKKMIAQRGDTVYRVGEVIIKAQQDFFLQIDAPLKPLRLKDVAEILHVHESTVSRAINEKYIETSFGIFELKSFFIQKFKQDNQEISAKQIQEMIVGFINEENKQKPLSDQKIVELLKEKKLVVSRRTVAKYREALKIPGSSKRKRYD